MTDHDRPNPGEHPEVGMGVHRHELWQKQLLTVGCAAGILACGACFREAFPPPPLPPPPVGVNFVGVHEIALSVKNGIGPYRLDVRNAAKQLKDSINNRRSGTAIHAHVATETGAQDALLEVTIDTDAPQPKGHLEVGRRVEWLIPVRVSARLTRSDGTLLWFKDNDDYSRLLFTKAQTPEEVLKERDSHTLLEDWVGYALMSQMFYGVKDQ